MDDIKEEKQSQNDEMEGGFAVVDRERIIDEEIIQKVPWYRYFFQAFTSPRKMIEACYGTEPYKGASYGIIGCLLFTILCCLILYVNPVYKAYALESLRNVSTENQLQPLYIQSCMLAIIGSCINVFFQVFIMASIIRIVIMVTKNNASFKNVYKMGLIVQMVGCAVSVVDCLTGLFIGTMNPVFQLGSLFANIKELPIVLQALCSFISIQTIIGAIWLYMGYKAINHTSKGAMIATVIYEAINYGMIYSALSLVIV